jgi:nicotinamide-nucleotide amidase
MVLDEPTEAKIAEILRPLAARWPDLDMEAVREANRKQAVVPQGATILDPVGTAPGLVVPPSAAGPTIVVLPGPPRELQPMWRTAVETEAFRAAIAGAVHYETAMLRLFGIPESEIAETLRRAREEGIDIDALEITTCLRRGEVEVVTRYEPAQAEIYRGFENVVRERHADTLFSDDGRSVDQQVADLLRSRGLTIATAESCTGGLLAARITDVAGAASYLPGGVVVYDRAAKEELGVAPATLDAHGEVSVETARELAERIRERRGAHVGVGITGIAGPDGGTPDKPVGLVCFSAVGPDGALTRSANLPGGRFDVRDRSTTIALHMVRRLLLGEHD